MKNVFENAYFGKAYKTKDGRKAIYLRMFICNGIYHLLSTGNTEFVVNEQGKVNKDIYPCGVDIISEWHKEINEEELDKLAIKAEKEHFKDTDLPFQSQWVGGFKAGCKEMFKRT